MCIYVLFSKRIQHIYIASLVLQTEMKRFCTPCQIKTASKLHDQALRAISAASLSGRKSYYTVYKLQNKIV